MANRGRALSWALGFLAAIVAANVVTNELGLTSFLGLTVTAGTWLAGLCFVLRDGLQDAGGRVWVLATIVAGALLSAAFGTGRIALASGLAFLVSESADMAVYTPLRRHGYVRAAMASNAVGALVDSMLFLWVAGFAVWANLPGQLVVKLLVTSVAVVLVVSAHAVSGKPVHSQSAGSDASRPAGVH